MNVISAIKRAHNGAVAASPVAAFAVLLAPVIVVTPRGTWIESSALLACIVVLARGSRWLRFIIVPIALVSVLQVGYFLYSRQEIDKFFWMAIQSTERAEAQSFFAALTLGQLSTLVAYTVVTVYLVYCLWVSKNCRHSLEKAVSLLVLATAAAYIAPFGTDPDMVAAGGANVRSRITSSYYATLVRSVLSASEFKISRTPMKLAMSPTRPDVRQILIVIGESESRLRMGAYGYDRDTTPLVGSDAYIFQNNIAIGLNTQPNVQTLLTGLLHVPSTGVDQDVFRIAKAAGYESIVIDNNDYKNDDPIVKISMEADHYISMNGVGATSTANDNKIEHDDVVLSPFEQQARIFGNRRALYVVHLIGSHPVQKMRYPRSFAKFPSYYDNSVLYTDYILSRLRDIFMQYARGPAVMIYVSDHGVRLPPGCGMGSIPIPEDAAYGADDRFFSNYAIPLIVWANPAFNEDDQGLVDQMRSNLSKPVDQMFLTYSVAQLMGVESVNRKPVADNSIFSSAANFEPRLNNFGKNLEEMFGDGKVCVSHSVEAYWKSGHQIGTARQ